MTASPQSGEGGAAASPRNDSEDATKIAPPMLNVACTATCGQTFGNSSRREDEGALLPLHLRARHVVLAHLDEDLGADDPRDRRREEDSDREREHERAAAESADDDQQEDERRERQEDVEAAHEQLIHPAAAVPGEQSERRAEDGRDRRAERTDEQCGLGTREDTREHVAADAIRAQPMLGARRARASAPVSPKGSIPSHRHAIAMTTHHTMTKALRVKVGRRSRVPPAPRSRDTAAFGRHRDGQSDAICDEGIDGHVGQAFPVKRTRGSMTVNATSVTSSATREMSP